MVPRFPQSKSNTYEAKLGAHRAWAPASTPVRWFGRRLPYYPQVSQAAGLPETEAAPSDLRASTQRPHEAVPPALVTSCLRALAALLPDVRLDPVEPEANPPACPASGPQMELGFHRAWPPASSMIRLLARRLTFAPVLPPGRLESLAAAASRREEAEQNPAWLPQPRSRVWRWLRAPLYALDSLAGLLLLPLRHRPLRWATALVAAIWFGASYGPASAAAASVLAPLHKRAAFLWEERFEDGLTHWRNASSLAADSSGAIRVQGLALHSRTLALRDYEMNFSAQIQKKSIGWVVRAAGHDNFYVFKLTDRGRSPVGLRFDLTRYPVLAGRAPARADIQTVPVTVRATDNPFLEISVRVTGNRVFTTINGWGIDDWKHPHLKAGGVGFIAENGESFLVRSLTISGNEDSLGLFLWGAEETFRSVRRTLMSLAAAVVR